jgi:hypothetical protein
MVANNGIAITQLFLYLVVCALGVLAGKLYVDALLRKSLCGENACKMDKRS